MTSPRNLPLLAALLVATGACVAHTPEIRPAANGRTVEPVASLEKLRLGGQDQWILIRGHDRSNPVLLWLHGGPGSAQMPARALNRELEETFVVVHWDQRGAGKSNPRGFDESTMTLQQFLDDAHELTALLKRRFDQDRIFLLGHSWGTQLGLLLVRDHPDDYHAYIGVSQLVHRDRSQVLAHEALAAMIAEAGNERDARRLAELGDPPYPDHADYVRFAGLFDRYGGNMDVGMGRLARAALAAPEYTLGDLLAWRRGAIRGSGPMWAEPAYHHFDAFTAVPSLDVPVYFLQGVRDLNTPLELVREYMDALTAPVRELVVFGESAHTPFFGEPARFACELARIRDEVEGEAVRRNEPEPEPGAGP